VDHSTPKRMRTPSCTGSVRSVGLSATGKGKLRGSVVSGLVVGASDEKDDFFSSSPSKGRTAGKSIPETPFIQRVNSQSAKTLTKLDLKDWIPGENVVK
jgi:hypothetical protein